MFNWDIYQPLKWIFGEIIGELSGSRNGFFERLMEISGWKMRIFGGNMVILGRNVVIFLKACCD